MSKTGTSQLPDYGGWPTPSIPSNSGGDLASSATGSQRRPAPAFAFNFVYSGNFLLEVEQVETGRLRCSGGIHPARAAPPLPSLLSSAAA